MLPLFRSVLPLPSVCCVCAVSRFFVFQVFATFIYQFVVGSALGRAQELIKDPSGQIVNILGVSAVQVGGDGRG